MLLALLRKGLDIVQMPWVGGLGKVTHDDARRPLMFPADTWYGSNPTFAFFGLYGLYERTGEDPDYPANALCIQGLHDGAILFNKGNETFLLTFEQVYELCVSLTDSAYSPEQRGWPICYRLIEWRKPVERPTGVGAVTQADCYKMLAEFSVNAFENLRQNPPSGAR